jgi:hypothetical protein
VASVQLALEPGYLPDKRVVSERAAETSFSQSGEHLGGRVGERPELFPQQSEHEVLAGDEKPRDRVAGRTAEDAEAACVARGGSEQLLVVGIAADDPVQDDDVGRLDPVRMGGDIVETPLRPSLESGLTEQLPCLVRLPRREFEVDRALRAPFQQLDLDLADASADLKHGRSLDSPLLEKLDHSARRLVEALVAVSPRHATSKAWGEEAVTPARVGAARHTGDCRGPMLVAMRVSSSAGQ